MQEIAGMTRHIVAQAKRHESDTVPGDFATLQVPCPKCGGVIKENYKKFQCQSCDFALWKIAAGRQFEVSEIEELISKGVVGPLQGFRSKMGKPFAGLIRMAEDFKPQFDFGQGNGDGAAEVDFSGQEPLGKCPKCGAQVFENGPSYICEKATGPNRTCDFRSGGVILQQPVNRDQMKKLLATGKTGLLRKFISKEGRPFAAYLVAAEGKVSFEFEPREAKAGRKKTGKGAEPQAPVQKIDFTGQEPLGNCPKCGGRIFESEKDYLCEKSQAEVRPCKFRIGKVILQQPVDRAQASKLLASGKTDLMDKFISKTGRPFPAFLVLEENGKVGFEFPPRDEAVNG